MRKTTKGRAMGALAAAVVVAVIALALAGGLLIAYFGGQEDAFAAGAVVVCALIYVAVAVGVMVALFQRWRELEKGEEDEARKY